jgi:hypothetical protein
MAALTGRTPGAPDNTYQGLLRLENPLSGSLETVIDGLGTATVIQISTTTVAISSLSLTTPLPIASGGTGAATTNANRVFAGPTTGPAAAPSFRSLVAADIPSLTSTNISDFDAAVTANSLSDFDSPTGDVTMNGFKLTSLGEPSSSSDAATKAYVDAIAAGFAPKPGAAVATVEPLPTCTYNFGTFGVGATLTGTANGELQVDGSSALVAPMRVLVKDQADAEENGLYVMTQQGTISQPFILTRHVAMDESDEIVGALIPVEDEGTTNAGTLWYCTNSTAPIIGTTHIEFSSFAIGSVSAGGSDTQVQYNSSGSLAGSDKFIWDNTAEVLTVTGGILPGTNSAYKLGTLNTAWSALYLGGAIYDSEQVLRFGFQDSSVVAASDSNIQLWANVINLAPIGSGAGSVDIEWDAGNALTTLRLNAAGGSGVVTIEHSAADGLLINPFSVGYFGAAELLTINDNGRVDFTPVASSTGSPSLLTVTGPAHTTLAASTEATDVNFNLARTVQFSSGALTTQRAVRLQAPTYAFVSASTLATAVTMDISGVPVAGTNATITNQIALRVGSGVAAGVALQLNAVTSQTGDMIQVRNVAGSTVFRVEDDGKINVPMEGSQQTGAGSITFGTSQSSIGSGASNTLEFNVANAYFLSFARLGGVRGINANGSIYWQTNGNNMLGLAQNYASDKPTGSTYGNCHHIAIGPHANSGFLSNSVLDIAGAITLTQRTTVSAAHRPCAIFEPFWNTSADSTRLGAVTVGVYDTTNLRVAIRFDGVSGGSSTTIYGDTTVQPFVRTTGSPTGFLYTGAAHTTLTASTESTDVNLNFARTVQFSTGALTTQRTIRIQAATYAFAGASTLTNAITLHLSGAPVAGTNATITNAIAAMFEAGHQNGVPLVLKGAGSQAKDLFQIQDSSGTVLNNCDKDGYMFPFAMGFNLGVGAPGVTGTNLSCVIQLPCDCKLVDVIAYAKTGPTGADAIFDVNYHATDDASATTIWSTQANRVRIVAGSKTGQSSTFNTSTFAKYGVLTIDWDQIGSTIAGQDVTITLWFRGKEAR